MYAVRFGIVARLRYLFEVVLVVEYLFVAAARLVLNVVQRTDFAAHVEFQLLFFDLRTSYSYQSPRAPLHRPMRRESRARGRALATRRKLRVIANRPIP